MNRDKRRFAEWLRRRFFLRFHMTLILLAAFASGLLVTKVLLELDANVLWLRYLVAVTFAYLVFLAAIKLWLMYIDGRGEVDLEGTLELGDAGVDAAVELGGFDFFDDFGIVTLALLAIVVLFAAFYAIWAAPTILAEAAFEAALASALVRRTKQIDAAGWVGSVVRRTIVPFVIVLLLSVGIGYAAQQWCPDAITIVQALTCG
ncbi:MAG TPA: hypothetical protein VGF48_25300 [Thermoanaerobaculia bacterium]|jgi:hypothetical protein